MRGNKTIKGGVRRQRVNPIYGNLPLVLHWLVLRWYCIGWYCAGIALVGIALVLHTSNGKSIHLEIEHPFIYNSEICNIEKAWLRWKCVNQTYSLAAYHQPTNTNVMIGDGGVDCGLAHVRGETCSCEGETCSCEGERDKWILLLQLLIAIAGFLQLVSWSGA